MIVSMKKAAVIVQSKDADSAIKTLGRLGLMHVEHQRLPRGKDINAIQDDIELISKAINILKAATLEKKAEAEKRKVPGDWKPKAAHVVDLYDRLNRLEEYERVRKNEISRWESWGDFNPDEIKSLADKNIHVRLYRVPVKNIKDFPSSVIVKKLSVRKGIANCAVISREKLEIPLKELALPKMSLATMRARLEEDYEVIQSAKDDMQKHLCYIDDFIRMKKSLEKELELQEALNGMGESGNIMYLTGYVPHDTVKPLLETAKEEKWGVNIKDPSAEDRVPTLIRNPRWVSIIEPIFKMIEVVPGYSELDASLWFLVFLSVFFGMLIGDAGYGIIFFILTILAHKKWGKKVQKKSVFILFYLLSSCAIIWGVLTGTFFGQAWLTQYVKPLIAALRDNKSLQAICFAIGAFHLSIAHMWRAITKLPSPRFLADIGWVSILWGAFFLAKTLILGENFPLFGKWFFIAGPVLVVLFTSLNKNIFKGIGSGLGNLLLNFVNSFTDVVSYIRLFAVGLATVAIADAFNNMAMGIGYNSFARGLVTSLILLLGHTLNILLGPLAVLVHGVRLNVLEFCNHLDVKWSGFSYRPLKKEGD